MSQVFPNRMDLLPEIGQQILQAVAARLERAKAQIEEEGRQKVLQLEAETQLKISEWVGMAKGQYPLAIGRALTALKEKPDILNAYQELYELSLRRPQNTTLFQGVNHEDLMLAEQASMGREASGPHEIAERQRDLS